MHEKVKTSSFMDEDIKYRCMFRWLLTYCNQGRNLLSKHTRVNKAITEQLCDYSCTRTCEHI